MLHCFKVNIAAATAAASAAGQQPKDVNGVSGEDVGRTAREAVSFFFCFSFTKVIFQRQKVTKTRLFLQSLNFEEMSKSF